jgi:integrase
MKGHFYKPNCKCPKKERCKCSAKWGFMIDVGINPNTGKRKQKFKGGFKTRKEAELAAAAFSIEVSGGNYFEEQDITFEGYAKDWIEWYQNTGKVKISTIRVRNHEIGRLSKYFAKLSLRSITKKKYQDALNDLKTSGLSTSTIEGVHVTGRMIFKKAVEQDVIKVDPTQYAYVPKQQKTVEELEAEDELPKFLEKKDLVKFLHAAKFKGLERDYVIFMLLAYTGLRAGELCALKWSDIDMIEQTISITKTYYNPKNNIKEYKLLPPKNPGAKRIINIEGDLIAVLEDHKALQNRIRMNYRNIYYDHDFVIAQMDGDRGYPEYIKKIENRMRRLLKYAGIKTDLTPHSLRHTHCSLLAEAGVPLHEIQDRLGHKDDNTTKHIYLHVTKAKKKEASFKFSEILKDASVK